MAKTPEPTTLLEAIRYFSDPQLAFDFVLRMRWPDGEITCPRCGCGETTFISTRRIWKCKGCRKQFSIKVGTIFEDSPLGFDKWLAAMWLICNSKNGISSYELGRAIGFGQKTAWFVLHRIRHAMATGSFQKLDGTVEVDETYVGGHARFMHENVRARKIHGRGGVDKIAIQGAMQRGGPVRAAVIDTFHTAGLQANVREWVESGATVYTDEAAGYVGLDDQFAHKSVNHRQEYVSGDVHTNSLENFWMLYKRAWRGTYTHNARQHTMRYIDERTFAFNHRDTDDLGRMQIATVQTNGRRLPWAVLTDKQPA
jgi:transposase-like protein